MSTYLREENQPTIKAHVSSLGFSSPTIKGTVLIKPLVFRFTYLIDALKIIIIKDRMNRPLITKVVFCWIPNGHIWIFPPASKLSTSHFELFSKCLPYSIRNYPYNVRESELGLLPSLAIFFIYRKKYWRMPYWLQNMKLHVRIPWTTSSTLKLSQSHKHNVSVACICGSLSVKQFKSKTQAIAQDCFHGRHMNKILISV